MTHPFEGVFAGNYGLIFLPLLTLTLLLTVVLSAIPLRPNIVEFELAGNTSKAGDILRTWDKAGQVRAAFSLGLDFLYLVVYSTTIGLACIWAAGVMQAQGWPLASLGVLLAWGLWLAALLDVVENVALVIILFGSVTDPWPQVAKLSAIFKFGLVILGLLYTGVGGLVQVGSNFP